MRLAHLLPFLLLSLTACDQLSQNLGLEDPAKKEARLEAEGKAVGGACRHSGRAIEDCYSIYSWLPKAAIFTGWRDMDAYMRDNKIDTVAPQLPPPQPPNTKKKKKSAEEGDNGDKSGEKAAEKAPDKAADKAPEKPAEKPAEKTEAGGDKGGKG